MDQQDRRYSDPKARINYVVPVGEGGSPKDDLLNRLYLMKRQQGGRGSKIANFETT